MSTLKKVSFFLALSFFAVGVSAQSVANIGGNSISSKEFMWVYKKNHAGVANASYQDLAAYLDLYINFKLKVADAREMSLDKDTAYLSEIEGYEKALKSQRKISTKSATYGYIINEYHEGVLMFNVSEKKIWNKVQDSEAELFQFYNKNKTTYNNKNFDEVRGQVVSDYQQNLESDWIKNLREKYAVKVNEAELRKLAKL